MIEQTLQKGVKNKVLFFKWDSDCLFVCACVCVVVLLLEKDLIVLMSVWEIAFICHLVDFTRFVLIYVYLKVVISAFERTAIKSAITGFKFGLQCCITLSSELSHFLFVTASKLKLKPVSFLSIPDQSH